MSGSHLNIFWHIAQKRWATEKNVSGVTCQATRELPFGDIATAQWLTTRPVEARVCMYATDQPTFSLRSDNSKCYEMLWSMNCDHFSHSETVDSLTGRTRFKLGPKLLGRSRGGLWPHENFHRDYAVTHMSAIGFEPVIVWLRITHALPLSQHATKWLCTCSN